MNLHRLLFSLVVSLSLFAATTAKADGSAKGAALEHFNAGLAHIDDPAGAKYEEAYREFKTAYTQYPSYEIAVNIGYCAFFLERDAEAIEMYELYLAKATTRDITKKKRSQMVKDLQSLRAGLVTVNIHADQREGILIDERFPTKGATIVNRYPIENGAAQLGIHPGSHRITVKVAGFEPQSWEFEAEPASAHAHDFKLLAVAARDTTNRRGELDGNRRAATNRDRVVPTSDRTGERKDVSPYVYVGATATGVFAVGAIGMGLAANAKKSSFESVNDGSRFERAKDLRSQAKTLALAADLCWGGAILSAGVTTYLIVAGRGNPSERERKAEHGGEWMLTPGIGRQQIDLALSGSF